MVRYLLWRLLGLAYGIPRHPPGVRAAAASDPVAGASTVHRTELPLHPGPVYGGTDAAD